MANNNWLNLNLDTTAPVGSIERSAEFYTANGKVYLESKDKDATYIKYWFSDKAAPSADDAGYKAAEWVNISTLPQDASAANKQYITTAFTADGYYYYHAIFKDSVANETPVASAATTSKITFETANPTVSSVSINNGAAYTTTRNDNTIKFNYTLPLSGISSARLSGNIVNDPGKDYKEITLTTSPFSGTFSFASDAKEGDQVVTVTLITVSGKTVTGTDTINLDTKGATATLNWRNSTDTANLPEFVGGTAAGIRISCADDDWVSYKIWGNFEGGASAEPEKDEDWITVTAAEKAQGFVFKAATLSSGDGAKIVYARVKDTAGNISPVVGEAPYRSEVRLDLTAPDITNVAISKQAISSVSGYNSATLTGSISDSGAGVAAWWIIKDSADTDKSADILYSGDGSNWTGSYEITQASLVTEGTHRIYVVATDSVGNSANTYASVLVDLSAPAIGGISVNIPDCGWYGGDAVIEADGFLPWTKFSATATATDATSIIKTWAWIDGNANPTVKAGEISGYITAFTLSNVNRENVVEGSTNYLHIVYEDSVGNVSSIKTSQGFGVDTTVPGAGSIDAPSSTYTRNIAVQIVPSDVNISTNKGYYKVWGDIENAGTEPITWKTFSNSTISVALTTGDGNKTLKVKWRDVAGNIQTAEVASKVVRLDTDDPDAGLSIFDKDNNTEIAGESRQVPEFRVHITTSDAHGADDGTKYFLYGNITNEASDTGTEYAVNTAYTIGTLLCHNANGKSGEDEVLEIYKLTSAVTAAENTGWNVIKSKGQDQFKDLIYTGSFFDTGVLTCTDSSGDKNIYVIIKDSVGNTSAPATAKFTYDKSAPEVVSNSQTRTIISKVHVVVDENNADEVFVTFKPNKLIQAWKLCAYLSKTAANSGSYANAAIAGCSGSQISSDDEITTKITGANFEAALGEAGTVDGVRYIVIYVQGINGAWSATPIIA